ncbi:uncharacterized protein LOC108342838 isoform X1 [Vigna angularis]|uniref:uncharacterized protein LOC108342838 isoform X1 n=1 Tax=Phaseolus angularis TaxID=3914 RepID=UPI0022B54754|nr:uncharacterized protein LOC108342838 isoform X1 [Vigna angularis]XP_052734807.1 uncharacterized protein LOC108342838 isoform X1 [Vigna angularis]
MSLPDSPVPDDIETDPSEEEEEVEEETEEEDEAEEVEEEEIEEEVEEEDFEEEVEEEEVEEVDEEEVDEEVEEEVEETELEEEEDEEGEGEQEVEEEEIEGEEEEEEEVEVEVEEEEEGEQELEEGEEEVQENEGEEEKQEQEALEDNKEDQQQKQREAVEEKKEEQPQQQEAAAKEKKEEQRQQQEEAVEEKKKEQEQQQEKAMEEKKKEQQLKQEAIKEKEGQQKEAVREDRLAVTGSPSDADLSLQMESKEQDKNLGPDYSVAENPEVIPPSSVHCMEETDAMLKISVPSCEILTLRKEELHLKYDISSHSKSRENLTNVENCRSQGLEVDVENAGSLLQKETQGGYSELGCNSKANLCDDNDIDSRVRATKSSSDTGQDMVNCLLPKDCIVEDASGGQSSRNNIKQLEREESRDDMKQTLSSRTRSMSPSAEIKNTNKRPKIICDFFAKGWCIRGSSCSFLHIKDTVDKTDQEAEADLVTAHQKRKLKVEEGVKDNVQRIRMNDQEQTPSWHPSQEKQNFMQRDNLFPENRFAFSSTSNYFNLNQDGMTTLRNQHIYKGHASTLLNHSPNSSLVTQFPSSSMSLSHRISSQSECSLPFNSSLGAGTQKILSTDKEYLTFKSTFSGSGREDFRLVSSSSVPSYPTRYKSKICSYDWEPSVPFRPSFFITPMNVSSPGDLYDPLRDSIEIPNIGDGSLKASLLIQGSNVLASSQAPIYGDSAVIGKYTSSVNDDKSSVSSHNKLYENEPNKNSVPHEKNTETEITSGTCVNYQNGKIGTGQNTLGVADSTKKEREMTEHDARRHGEGSGHKTKRGDRDKKNHEIDVDFQMDGSMQKEPKALKMLRAALVDHVKELLKPVWHEGRLSKDAHIMIVRKSVDKVVSTIEPHQIATIDTAKQYVSSSRAKIAKLVNGYVNKYGKS